MSPGFSREQSSRGVVLGRFYPPHRGHASLLRRALEEVDELTIIVSHRKDEKIPGELRARWLSEMAPTAEILLVPDLEDGADPKTWADYTLGMLGSSPDLVFTSDPEADAYAEYLGSDHWVFDKDRVSNAVSSEDIRRRPLDHWHYLPGGAQAFFAVRVVVIGAESTGTTTMAETLAAHYETVWVPEFGRTYSEGKRYTSALQWDTSEFTFVAEQQNRMEDELAAQANKVLICDTDCFAVRVWHEHYLGFMSQEIDKLCAGRRAHLYLLTDTDIPFIQDGTRSSEHVTQTMHDRFVEELTEHNKQFVVLSGAIEERKQAAVDAVDDLIASNPTHIE